MFSSLRTRLIFSYILIIGLTLCIVSVALIVLLANSRIPAEQTYQRLQTVLRTSMADVTNSDAEIDTYLAEVARTEDVRVLRLNNEREVVFDSLGQIEAGQRLPLQAAQTDDATTDNRVQRGIYRDGDRAWLYLALIPGRPNQDIGMLVFAAPRPRLPVFTNPASDLLQPIIQAGLIGVILSVLLAILISRSVARPVRRTVDAANAIAAGSYGQQVKEQGPTELKELARAFNAMSQEVQRSRETQRDFLANVTHELKTPLTSVQGYAQAILDGAAPDPQRAAQVIYDESGRMHRMVEDLLDLARLESGQAHFSREHVDLSNLLTSVVDHLSLQASDQQITLTHHIDPLPRMTGDNDRLSQVFTNLADNALTHTPAGGTVEVSAHTANHGVEVRVKDTGKGIPPEAVNRVFERFYQVEKARARSGRKGTGLGLTICKEIVEIHGGTIRAESPPEGGGLFVVWLPLPRPQDETVVDPSITSRRSR